MKGNLPYAYNACQSVAYRWNVLTGKSAHCVWATLYSKEEHQLLAKRNEENSSSFWVSVSKKSIGRTTHWINQLHPLYVAGGHINILETKVSLPLPSQPHMRNEKRKPRYQRLEVKGLTHSVSRWRIISCSPPSQQLCQNASRRRGN